MYIFNNILCWPLSALQTRTDTSHTHSRDQLSTVSQRSVATGTGVDPNTPRVVQKYSSHTTQQLRGHQRDRGEPSDEYLDRGGSDVQGSSVSHQFSNTMTSGLFIFNFTPTFA